MGSRAADKLKEIDALKASMETKIDELQRRLPAAVQLGRKGLALLAGAGGGGSALWLAKKVVGRRRRKAKAAAASLTPVVVRVMPGGVVPAAIAVAVVWAGVRIFEARTRMQVPAGREPVTSTTPIRSIAAGRGR